MLAGAAIVRDGGKAWFGRPRLFAVAAALWLVLTLVLTLGPPAARLEIERDGAVGPLLLGAAALVGAGLALAFVAQGRARAGVAAMAAGALLAWINLFGVTLPALDRVFLSPRIMAAVDAHKPCPATRLTLLDYHEPSLVFLHGPGVVLARSPEEAAASVAEDPACSLALVGDAGRDALTTDLAQRGYTASEVARIEGLNHNEGGAEAVTLHRAVPIPVQNPARRPTKAARPGAR
jgi:hypothetical protein